GTAAAVAPSCPAMSTTALAGWSTSNSKAPWEAISVAMARPRPPAAPVMTATWSVSMGGSDRLGSLVGSGHATGLGPRPGCRLVAQEVVEQCEEVVGLVVVDGMAGIGHQFQARHWQRRGQVAGDVGSLDRVV